MKVQQRTIVLKGEAAPGQEVSFSSKLHLESESRTFAQPVLQQSHTKFHNLNLIRISHIWQEFALLKLSPILRFQLLEFGNLKNSVPHQVVSDIQVQFSTYLYQLIFTNFKLCSNSGHKVHVRLKAASCRVKAFLQTITVSPNPKQQLSKIGYIHSFMQQSDMPYLTQYAFQKLLFYS